MGQAASDEEIRQYLQNNAHVIDVRTASEFSSGHFPNAKNISLDKFPHDQSIPSKDQYIILYCRSGNRSGQAAEKLKQLGYETVINGGGLDNMNRFAQ